MGFQWTDFLHLAEDLNGSSTTIDLQEAKCRSAISRAYYAAFHRAKDHMVSKNPGTNTQSGLTHQSVIFFYEHSGRKDWQHVGESLKRLFAERKRADYDEPRMSKKAAGLAIENARDIIDSVSRL